MLGAVLIFDDIALVVAVFVIGIFDSVDSDDDGDGDEDAHDDDDEGHDGAA